MAAYKLGAEKVYSFDYDQDSVACTKYLKERYAQGANNWTVEQGSVLDEEFLKKFATVDIVYSWGVLHHTGHMYQAFENVSHLVKDSGQLFISIYNDQGWASLGWRSIKKAYVIYPLLRRAIEFLCCIWLWKYRIAWGTLRYGNPLKFIWEYDKNNRGMSAWHDVVDWVGGYPFEVAKPEEVFEFYAKKGFSLQKLKTCGGKLGCNEFVFVKK